MKISVLQVDCEGKNEFEIEYDGVLKYKAKLPFISIENVFNLDKLRKIKIFDVDDKEVYRTDYKYIENLGEEIVPMKFLITGTQKFNQLLFISDNNTIKIYYEENAIWVNRYVIEFGDKKYYCYSVEDGYIRHLPIYDGEVQIGEVLKSNIIVDGKDEYCCYLKDEYKNISDGIVSLLLYLDRSEYNSSYLLRRGYEMSKAYTYNKNNKYYDKEWVKNNFGDEFFKKVDDDVVLFKKKWKEQMSKLKKYFMFGFLFMLIIFVIILIVFKKLGLF